MMHDGGESSAQGRGLRRTSRSEKEEKKGERTKKKVCGSRRERVRELGEGEACRKARHFLVFSNEMRMCPEEGRAVLASVCSLRRKGRELEEGEKKGVRVYTDAWSSFLCVFFPFGPQPPMYGLYSIYIVRALRIICGVVDGVGVASELI